MDRNKRIRVKNRNNGPVGYTIPELGVRRQFMPKEEKGIPFEELERLSYMRGGMKILEKYLVIRDEEALKLLMPHVEPEYFYEEKDVYRMLTTASYNEFLDCLDFAPTGVLEMIQDMAVKMELNDIRKRNAIYKKTGFNVTKVIENNKYDYDGKDDAAEPVEEATKPTRRVSTAAAEPQTGRRAEAPKYSFTPKTEE